jgi:hypothetical protein
MYFLQLNEFNFDLIVKYAESGRLKNFRKLLDAGLVEQRLTERDANLEPWIQWVNIYTGSEFSDHGVFRLGHGHELTSSFFHDLRNAGLSQICICPMNSPDLAAFEDMDFIPDPWGDYRTNGDFFSRALASVAKQSVNDNAQNKITIATYLRVLLLLIWSFDHKKMLSVLLVISKSRKKKWLKAMVFEQLLALVCLKKTKKVPDFDFCSVFFNGIAHTQHHYLRSSKVLHDSDVDSVEPDPLEECLQVMDEILGWFLDSGREVTYCTGLSQEVYLGDVLYWRPIAHADLLKALNLEFADVRPCMTRDFEIYFNNAETRAEAVEILSGCQGVKTGRKVFDVDDAEPNKLFCTLTYSLDLDEHFSSGGASFDPKDHLAFVARKNGGHRPISYFGVWSVDQDGSARAPLPTKIEDIRSYLASSLGFGVPNA